MKITYKKMSLFDAPQGSYLVHACNTNGVWGSGIATEFKKRFPKAFEQYETKCKRVTPKEILGESLIFFDEGYPITCLMVSDGYGQNKSPKKDILLYTELALSNLLEFISEWDSSITTVYSNRFNSGFFKVPWHETEKVLKEALKEYNIEWIVCDPELGDSPI